MTMKDKHEQLRQYLRGLGSVAVAFSGGVDSSFLLETAREVLGNQVIAITARSRLIPERELKEAVGFCEERGIRYFICDLKELEIEGFSENPLNRCYLCKNKLFTKIWGVAREQSIPHVAEGSNMDDNSDYRPGHMAVEEQGIKSPLRHVKLTKKEIRALSKEMGLPTWDKPSFACLASRFPYGERITAERLSMIDKAEQFLVDAGFRQVRVRYHGGFVPECNSIGTDPGASGFCLARIEADRDGFLLLEDPALREKIYSEFRRIGFSYVASDLLGYRTGSMNETIE